MIEDSNMQKLEMTLPET